MPKPNQIISLSVAEHISFFDRSLNAADEWAKFNLYSLSCFESGKNLASLLSNLYDFNLFFLPVGTNIFNLELHREHFAYLHCFFSSGLPHNHFITLIYTFKGTFSLRNC